MHHLNGEQPFAGLVQDTNGTFYGTTVYGGADYGTVFSLSVGLGPFVETNPLAGKAGAKVAILGTDLTGATGVEFNGTATAFRVVSSSFIEAKVCVASVRTSGEGWKTRLVSSSSKSTDFSPRFIRP